MGRKQPSLHFDPPLEHAIVLKTPLAPTLGSRLRWHAVLPREDYSSLCIDGIKVQLWSDASKVGEWSETMFEERVQLDLFDQAVQHVDISLVESTDKPEPSSDLVSLEATVLLSPLIGRTVQYTYRLVDASGEVRWLGTEDTNGTIVLSAAEDANTLRIKDWTRDEHGVFSWTSTDAREAMIVTKVSGDAHWKCWACTSEGHFSAISSTATNVEALCLLPPYALNRYIVYSPVFYVAAHGTLSLNNRGDVLFRAWDGDSEAAVRVHVWNSTWRALVPDKAAILDVNTAELIGVSSTLRDSDVGHIHFLPASSLWKVITMNSSDATSLISSVSSESVFLLNATSYPTKFVTSITPHQNISIVVDASGGEILVVPGYTLSSEFHVACFLSKPGDIAFPTLASTVELGVESSLSRGYSPSSSSNDDPLETIPTAQPPSRILSTDLLVLAMYLLRYLMELALYTAPTAAPAVSLTGQTHDLQEPADTMLSSGKSIPPNLGFKVTGKYTLLVKGENISRIFVRIDGRPLPTNPKAVGVQHWLIEDELGPNTAQLEIYLNE